MSVERNLVIQVGGIGLEIRVVVPALGAGEDDGFQRSVGPVGTFSVDEDLAAGGQRAAREGCEEIGVEEDAVAVGESLWGGLDRRAIRFNRGRNLGCALIS